MDHEKLFEEICGKLNELSQKQPQENTVLQPQSLEKMQSQIKKFQSELQDAHTELHDKIKNIENVQIAQTDLNQQLKQTTEQLQHERTVNTKLNTDLAKSLELCLQLQLEIQGVKSRSLQMQNEEKKYSQSLLEKIKNLTRDCELSKALKEEIEVELNKAKTSFQNSAEEWKLEKQDLIQQINDGKSQIEAVLKIREQLQEQIESKEQTIQNLHGEIGKMSSSFEEIESSAQKQTEVMKNLMEVAESKIVEMKLALDKKSLESQDYYSHLQQALTQASLLKQENANLKEYISKINQHLQNQSQAQAQ